MKTVLLNDYLIEIMQDGYFNERGSKFANNDCSALPDSTPWKISLIRQYRQEYDPNGKGLIGFTKHEWNLL
jgi:hypothetical protein